MKALIRFVGAAVMSAAMLAGGCKKRAPVADAPITPPPAVAETTEAAPAEGADPAAGGAPKSLFTAQAPLAPAAAANPFAEPPPAAVPSIQGDVHPFMTQQLHIFIAEKKRMPTSFGEFSMSRMDSVPIPPPGKKWAIDEASQSVLSVKK